MRMDFGFGIENAFLIEVINTYMAKGMNDFILAHDDARMISDPFLVFKECDVACVG